MPSGDGWLLARICKRTVTASRLVLSTQNRTTLPAPFDLAKIFKVIMKVLYNPLSCLFAIIKPCLRPSQPRKPPCPPFEKPYEYSASSSSSSVSSTASLQKPTTIHANKRDGDENGNRNCVLCRKCHECSDCVSCNDCRSCQGCVGCSDCSGCKNCTGCIDCIDCIDCVGAKGLRGAKNVVGAPPISG